MLPVFTVDMGVPRSYGEDPELVELCQKRHYMRTYKDCTTIPWLQPRTIYYLWRRIDFTSETSISGPVCKNTFKLYVRYYGQGVPEIYVVKVKNGIVVPLSTRDLIWLGYTKDPDPFRLKPPRVNPILDPFSFITSEEPFCRVNILRRTYVRGNHREPHDIRMMYIEDIRAIIKYWSVLHIIVKETSSATLPHVTAYFLIGGQSKHVADCTNKIVDRNAFKNYMWTELWYDQVNCSEKRLILIKLVNGIVTKIDSSDNRVLSSSWQIPKVQDDPYKPGNQ